MITKKVCPDCGGDDMKMMGTGMLGTYMCNSCGYEGEALEKPYVGREDSDEEIVPMMSSPLTMKAKSKKKAMPKRRKK